MIASFLFSLATPFHTGPIHATAPPLHPYVAIAAQSNINGAISPCRTVQAHELAASTWLSSSFEPIRQYSWNLPNGNVGFETPLVFSVTASGKDGRLNSGGGGGGGDSFVSLSNPIFLGRYTFARACAMSSKLCWHIFDLIFSLLSTLQRWKRRRLLHHHPSTPLVDVTIFPNRNRSTRTNGNQGQLES